MRITVGYPAREHEQRLLASHRVGEPVDELKPVLELSRVLELQQIVREVRFDESLVTYLLDIIHATRENDSVEVGVSTRGAIAYYRAAQALATVENRDHVIPDDIKRLAIPVLAHRIVPRGSLPGADRSAAEEIVRQILDRAAVPV